MLDLVILGDFQGVSASGAARARQLKMMSEKKLGISVEHATADEEPTRLHVLVCELLIENRKLRFQVAQLERHLKDAERRSRRSRGDAPGLELWPSAYEVHLGLMPDEVNSIRGSGRRK
jgi:hypothetical protein